MSSQFPSARGLTQEGSVGYTAPTVSMLCRNVPPCHQKSNDKIEKIIGRNVGGKGREGK